MIFKKQKKYNKYYLLWILIILLTIFLFKSAYSQINNTGYADLVEKLMPAVVNISVKHKVTSVEEQYWPLFPKNSPFEDLEEYFKRFMYPYDMNEDEFLYKTISLGSGFLIDSNGLIVTNHHVIENAYEIKVKLNNNKIFIAKIIGADPQSDLAVIKIDSKTPLFYVNFGDSDKIRVGEYAISIGNPFGLVGTVTLGIVSAHARDIGLMGSVDEFIQTDASLNKGNSGSPLFNLKGEVIGITTSIASSPGFENANTGIGFAIPSSIASPIIEKLKDGINIKRGFIGVKVQDINDDLAESLDLDLENNQAVIVIEVSKNSPAEKAGIKTGDIILKFNKETINNSRKLLRIVSQAPINQKAEITLINQNGVKKKINIIIHELENQFLNDQDNSKNFYDDLNILDIDGAKICKLNEQLRKKYNINKDIKGALVVNVKRGSEWYDLGVQQGDVIQSANRKIIISPKELENIIKTQKNKGKKYLPLLINRSGTEIFIAIEISKLLGV